MIAPQIRPSPSFRRRRPTSGTRPRSTLSPSLESSAGNTVSEQTLALFQENLERLGIRLEMRPLEGAREFLDWLRAECQVVILSDTYYQFAAPLMRQLGYPTLFCHELVVAPGGRVRDYRLRMPDQKRASVKAFKKLNFHTIAAGDSYNDTTMLAEADAGILFCPPANVAAEFPQFPVTRDYDELRRAVVAASSV